MVFNLNRKTNLLKAKLKNQEITFGSWITIGDQIVAEIMANTGFDWLTIDMEHSAITLDIAQYLIQIIELSKCVPLVRVGENNPLIIKRVMDAGAHGVIVPMVNSREDAEKAVNAVKYPPKGFRGVGLARAQGYGFNFEEYKKWLNEDSIVIVQIEHIDAVKKIDEILTVDGVDGFIVGPYDISGSLGKPGEFGTEEFKSIMEKIVKAGIKHKKTAGFHVIPPDEKEVKKYIEIGYTFIGISLDTLILGTKCKEVLSKLK